VQGSSLKQAAAQIFLVLGLMLLCIAGYVAFNTTGFLTNSVRVDGVVVGNKIQASGDPDSHEPVFCPVFNFRTLDGRRLTATADVCSTPASYKPDTQVTVIYDPQNPEKAAILDSNVGFLPGLLALMGIGFAGFGWAAKAR